MRNVRHDDLPTCLVPRGTAKRVPVSVLFPSRNTGLYPGETGNGSDSRARRGTRPTGLPHSPQTPASKVFVLAKLTPQEGDLSVKDLGRGRETRA
jgi:hypothetical protein